MAITERTEPYEIFVRYRTNAAGERTVHAHQRSLTQTLNNGVITGERENDAVPLDPALVKDMVGEMLPALVAERDALLLDRAALAAALVEAQAKLATLEPSE